MMRALWTAASGLGAEQMKMDVLANNLANVDTNGFKASRADFEDLLYEQLRRAGTVDQLGQQIPLGLEVGHGVRTADTTKNFTEGTISVTNNSLDLCINGQGFFQISMPDGSLRYTRDGALQMDGNGRIVTSDGYPLEPAVTIPNTATGIAIGSTGQVQISLANGTNQVVGQIQLANFLNPAGLESEGQNLYQATDAAGQITVGTPGTDTIGTIQQGALEQSNVSVVTEMVNMITSQRSYESNTKVITAADTMLSEANNMRYTG
jgi:flagellar basal-body rod protein FlgG